MKTKYRKVRQHLPVDNIKLIMASIISGGERLYDVRKFENDPVIPDLFGISLAPKMILDPERCSYYLADKHGTS